MNSPEVDRQSGHGRGKTPWWILFVAAAVPLVLLAYVATHSHVMQAQMFRDPFDAVRIMEPGQYPPLLGLVSNFGVVLWAAAWAVACFTALALYAKGEIRNALFALSFAVISGLLLTDDLLQMHEMVYPHWFGVDEKTIFAVYAIVVGAWFLVYRDVLKRIGPGLLLCAGVAFSLGIAGDLVNHFEHDLGMIQRWMEDAPKLFGICFWTAFAQRAAWVLLEIEHRSTER